jgi:curved DNA-binding protein CbpA
MSKALILLLLVCFSVRAAAQERTASIATTDTLPKAITLSNAVGETPILPQTIIHPGGNIDWTRFSISAGVLGASFTGLHILQANSWWSKDRQSFHIYDDPDYKANFDKFGHAFAPYIYAHFFDDLYSWSGFDSAQSTLMAALSGALYQFYVEIEDGYGKDWGFSPGDAAADLMGSAFYLLRNRIEPLRNLNYKWLYYPSYQMLHGSGDINGQTLNPIDDYGGQSYWITVDIHRMLPESDKKYWPEWLNLAIGAAGYHIGDFAVSTQKDVYIKPEVAYFVALDFEIEKIIPKTNIGVIDFIVRGLNYWHLPAPAFRITPEPKFFFLFPLRMTI